MLAYKIKTAAKTTAKSAAKLSAPSRPALDEEPEDSDNRSSEPRENDDDEDKDEKESDEDGLDGLQSEQIAARLQQEVRSIPSLSTMFRALNLLLSSKQFGLRMQLVVKPIT